MINWIEWKYNLFRKILLLTLEWLSKHTTSTNNQRFQAADTSVLKNPPPDSVWLNITRKWLTQTSCVHAVLDIGVRETLSQALWHSHTDTQTNTKATAASDIVTQFQGHSELLGWASSTSMVFLYHLLNLNTPGCTMLETSIQNIGWSFQKDADFDSHMKFKLLLLQISI